MALRYPTHKESVDIQDGWTVSHIEDTPQASRRVVVLKPVEKKEAPLTHPETIQVPDGLTIVEVETVPDGHRDTALKVHLKYLPPPEPPIKNCPMCGGMLDVIKGSKTINQEWTIIHNTSECEILFQNGYPSRAAAIEAANRRA